MKDDKYILILIGIAVVLTLFGYANFFKSLWDLVAG
jgi:hypothetical protein